MEKKYVHVYGSKVFYTKPAETMVNEEGKETADAVYHFLGAAYRARELDKHLTKSGQVGVGTVRAAKATKEKGELEPPTKQQRRPARSKRQRPKQDGRLQNGGPVFITTFGPTDGTLIFGSRVIVNDEVRKMTLHKEGHTEDPPIDVSIRVQRFPEPFRVDRRGYSHYCVRVLEVSPEPKAKLEVSPEANGNGHKPKPQPSRVEKFRARHGDVKEVSLTRSDGPSGENILSFGEAKRDPSIDWEAASRQRKEAMHGTPPSRGEAVAGTRRKSASAR